MLNLGRYLYGVIACQEVHNFGRIGIGDTPTEVYTLPYKELAAVVSNTPIKTYDPIRKNAMAHEKVIKTVMQEFTIVPAQFGLVCKDEHEVKQVLREHYDDLQQKLNFLNGKIELGLKIWWKKELFQAEMFKSNPELGKQKQAIEQTAGEKYYVQAVDFGKLVEQTADKLRKHYEGLIYKPLCEIAVAGKLNKIIGELMILNSSFLVEKNREEEFDWKVNELFLAHREHLNFKYSGPWPSYNFVDLHIR